MYKLYRSVLTSSHPSQPLNSVRCQFIVCLLLVDTAGYEKQNNDNRSRSSVKYQYKLLTQLCSLTISFNNNNSFSVVYILAISDIFQICVLLDLTYQLTGHIVCPVKVIPLALRVQVPAHLVRLEQWRTKRGLNVVITTWFNISS